MQQAEDAASPKTTVIVVPSRLVVPFEQKRNETRNLLGWNDSIVAGQTEMILGGGQAEKGR